MDRDLPALPAIAFVASLLLALYVYMHNIAGITHAPVSQMVSDSTGKVWALYGDALIRLPIGSNPAAEQTLSLRPLGIEHTIGEVIPLPNGGWLVNTGRQAQSISTRIKRLLHSTTTDKDSGKGSLLKCNATLEDCHPWGDTTLNFDQRWGGLALDNGQFLIYDHTRHQVHLVTADGTVVSTLSGFRFPAQIRQVNDKYWVLDSHNNQLIGIYPDADQLTRTGETVDFGDTKGIAGQHQFPDYFLPEGQDWWILSRGASMEYPGLYRVSATQATRYGFDLQDATAIYHDGKAIYVADPASRGIKRVDVQNRQSTPLNSAGLTQQTQTLDARTATNRHKVWMLIGAILAAGFGLLVLALRKSQPVDNNTGEPALWLSTRHIKINDPDYPPSGSSNQSQVIWLKPNTADIHKLSSKRLFINLGLGGVMLLIGALAFLIYTKTRALAPTLYFLIVFMTSLLIIATVINRFINRVGQQFTHKKIGFINEKIVLAQQDLPPEEITAADTLYTDSNLCLNGHHFAVQTPDYVFVDKEHFERHAVPLISKGKRVLPSVLHWHALKSRRDKTLWIEFILIAIAGVCIGLVAQIH